MNFRIAHRSLAALTAAFLAVSCSSAAPTSDPTEVEAGTEAPTATVPVMPTITSLPSLTPVRTPDVGGLYVDAASVQGPISPLVYGTNYGPWLIVPVQRQEEALAAHLTVIRYPGGNWGDDNDLQEWQIDSLMAFTQQMGAEATFNVRLKNGTPEKAAELVRYINIEKKYGVKYWAIGNEPNLFPDGYETEQFNREWREFAEAMRAVDPSIKLIGPEVSQFCDHPSDEYGQEIIRWVIEFLKANGDMVDIVSFHRYPFPASRSSGSPSPDELLASTREWDALIPAMRALAREYAGRDLPVAVTEVNSSWLGTAGGDTTLDSHFNAIWWGDALGRMIRQGTFMVNQFDIVGDYGLMSNFELYPIYYVYQMYQHFGTILVYATSDDPKVSVFAATREDGALTVMMVNHSRTSVDQTLTIDGFTSSDPSEVWLFDTEHAAIEVDSASVMDSGTLHLPATSMTLIVMERSE